VRIRRQQIHVFDCGMKGPQRLNRIQAEKNIAQELLGKRALLEPAIRAKGYDIVQANSPPESSSAIVSMYRPGSDLMPLHQKLLDARIFTSLRADRTGQKYIRLSPHFYNTDAEFDRLLAVL